MKVKTNTLKDSLLTAFEKLRNSIPAQLVLAGLIIGGVSFFLWYQYLYLGTQSVFDGMLAQSLQTRSYTRIDTTTGEQGVSQVVHNQVQFGVDPFVRRLTTVSQEIGGQKNFVQREALGTPKADFERLVKVEIPSQPEAVEQYKATQGKWVRMSAENTDGRYLVESIFGIIPMAPLQPEQQKELLDYLTKENIYSIDTTVPIKKATVADTNVYVYTVKVKTSGYLKYLQEFSEAVGLKDAASFDPEQYAGQADATIELAIEPRSRQIIEVKFPNNPNRTESYSSYGVINDFIEPKVEATNPQLPVNSQE